MKLLKEVKVIAILRNVDWSLTWGCFISNKGKIWCSANDNQFWLNIYIVYYWLFYYLHFLLLTRPKRNILIDSLTDWINFIKLHSLTSVKKNSLNAEQEKPNVHHSALLRHYSNKLYSSSFNDFKLSISSLYLYMSSIKYLYVVTVYYQKEISASSICHIPSGYKWSQLPISCGP